MIWRRCWRRTGRRGSRPVLRSPCIPAPQDEAIMKRAHSYSRFWDPATIAVGVLFFFVRHWREGFFNDPCTVRRELRWWLRERLDQVIDKELDFTLEHPLEVRWSKQFLFLNPSRQLSAHDVLIMLQDVDGRVWHDLLRSLKSMFKLWGIPQLQVYQLQCWTLRCGDLRRVDFGRSFVYIFGKWPERIMFFMIFMAPMCTYAWNQEEVSNQRAKWSAMDSPHKPFQLHLQWPICRQEALLRGNATKELEAVQQAAAEAGTLEMTRDLWKRVEDKARNGSSNYAISCIMENCRSSVQSRWCEYLQSPGAGISSQALCADICDWAVERWRIHDTNRIDLEALQLLTLKIKIINKVMIIYINA